MGLDALRQQTLAVWPSPETRLEAFEPGPNAAVVDALRAEHSLFIHGPHGSGKTHLAQALIGDVGGFYYNSRSSFVPEVLEGLESQLVILDDSSRSWAILNGNRVCFLERRLIAKLESFVCPKAGWSLPISLPDYAPEWDSCRICASPLSEADIAQALSRRARVADLRLPPEVIEYLLRHHAPIVNWRPCSVKLSRAHCVYSVPSPFHCKATLCSKLVFGVRQRLLYKYTNRQETRLSVSLVTRNEHRKTP